MKEEKPLPINVTPENIWNFSQNRPSEICQDFLTLFDVPTFATARILMARGVYKWLAVRRSLIKLKHRMREQLSQMYPKIGKDVKRGTPEYFMLRGRIQAYEEIRSEIRKLCHSDRWQFPDHDTRAERLLATMPRESRTLPS